MRQWKICYPSYLGDVIEIIDEQKLFLHEFEDWCDRMNAVGKNSVIDYNTFLYGWVAVNWAKEIP